MFQYSHYTYCLQEESTHFGLRVSTYFYLEVLPEFFGTKDHARKIDNILKDF